mmetsp:Transcript_25688/g.59374  ORF Transcript_25688/g.59374 Transcript_25688/m.59374 type:complete len:104 (-) Transcript_25688:47-358(-)
MAFLSISINGSNGKTSSSRVGPPFQKAGCDASRSQRWQSTILGWRICTQPLRRLRFITLRHCEVRELRVASRAAHVAAVNIVLGFVFPGTRGFLCVQRHCVDD